MDFRTARTLAELAPGAEGVLESIDLPEDDARRLMELGFLPGSVIRFTRRSPFGGPGIYQVDGVEVALRPETASQLAVAPVGAPAREAP